MGEQTLTYSKRESSIRDKSGKSANNGSLSQNIKLPQNLDRAKVWGLDNALLILFSLNVAIAVQVPRGNGVAAWLVLAALLFSNAVFHIIGAIHTKRYSPGMISGILLYVPLSIYGYSYFFQSGLASIETILTAIAIGGSYHFIAFARHRRRTKKAVGES